MRSASATEVPPYFWTMIPGCLLMFHVSWHVFVDDDLRATGSWPGDDEATVGAAVPAGGKHRLADGGGVASGQRQHRRAATREVGAGGAGGGRGSDDVE